LSRSQRTSLAAHLRRVVTAQRPLGRQHGAVGTGQNSSVHEPHGRYRGLSNGGSSPAAPRHRSRVTGAAQCGCATAASASFGDSAVTSASSSPDSAQQAPVLGHPPAARSEHLRRGTKADSSPSLSARRRSRVVSPHPLAWQHASLTSSPAGQVSSNTSSHRLSSKNLPRTSSQRSSVTPSAHTGGGLSVPSGGRKQHVPLRSSGAGHSPSSRSSHERPSSNGRHPSALQRSGPSGNAQRPTVAGNSSASASGKAAEQQQQQARGRSGQSACTHRRPASNVSPALSLRRRRQH